MIRVFVIDDHPVIVKGLRDLFRSGRDGIEVIDGALSVMEALDKADPATFDIIILDLWLPNAHPILNVQKLKDHFQGKPIVVFTSEDSSDWKRRMYEAGVAAYLFKGTRKAEIKATLEKIFKGLPVTIDTTESSSGQQSVPVLAVEQLSLTPRQQEIILLLSKGISLKEIAEIKEISISTVVKTIKNIREKFDAKSNDELVQLIMEQGHL